MNNFRALAMMTAIAGGMFGSMELEARVTPTPLITPHAVLQQNSNARVWGTAKPNTEVTVVPLWNGKTYSTKSDKDGRWLLTVETPAGGYTPYSLTISDGEPLVVDDIMIGEVWLASGQSNMQMPLKGYPGCPIRNGWDEALSASSRSKGIRFLTVPLTQSWTPAETVNAVWTVPSPETAPDYSAVAWHFAKEMEDVLQVPIGIVSAAYGGARVESWLPRDILETYPDESLKREDVEAMEHYMRPLLAYNAMFEPIKNYNYKGILWYQGCSNCGTWSTYADRLATMVERWRKEIGLGDIPFYSVEIAPYQFGQPGEVGCGPYLREAQWKAMDMVPNAAIVSTNDLVEKYERRNVHPQEKKTIGHRLANLALNKTYGKQYIPYESPRYESHSVSDGKVMVTLKVSFDLLGRMDDMEGFEVAGNDKVFYPATTVKLVSNADGKAVLAVSSDAVKNPVAVRYGFRDFMPGNVYGGDYMPLVPFRTDNW